HPLSRSFLFLPPAPTPSSTLSLHDALPISPRTQLGRVRQGAQFGGSRDPAQGRCLRRQRRAQVLAGLVHDAAHLGGRLGGDARRSEEHTSELQSLRHLVCRLLLEKKKNT